jgi:hypothetical protein
MNIDLQQLRSLAMKATSGPWYVDRNDYSYGIISYLGDTYETVIAFRDEILAKNPQQAERNTVYVAALAPEVVLALLDRLEQAEAALFRSLDAK